jgi:DNA-binding NarL/FixJ family response regulator
MRDKEILKRLKQGKAPKEVAYEMGLSSVWVVYDASRRRKLR